MTVNLVHGRIILQLELGVSSVGTVGYLCMYFHFFFNLVPCEVVYLRNRLLHSSSALAVRPHNLYCSTIDSGPQPSQGMYVWMDAASY